MFEVLYIKKLNNNTDVKIESDLMKNSSIHSESYTYNLENILVKKEIESGQLKKFKSVDELWSDLND